MCCATPPPGIPEAAWLTWRVALVAAAEHMTHMLGDWVLEASALDADGADAVMVDLLRWHGSEEIEHCAVAFDMLEKLAGPAAYPARAGGMLVSFPVLAGLWHLGLLQSMAQDDRLGRRAPGPFEYFEAARRGHAPGGEVWEAFFGYFRPDFHPAAEAAFEKAEAYLAVSPGVAARVR